ncbi:hypothetical protein BCR44DRAFT_1170189 [Catenaria anguillulae PL171]|uniref:GYF domain-containing protein n=1 Tax=Catenaria anguillulae PL171 TaxID=765915 RepID=A0A1Y2I011_9FUNG|nr:hypothetical protein BCR44DRAFT_1170189 [Catenaria anguillulae PL171]
MSFNANYIAPNPRGGSNANSGTSAASTWMPRRNLTTNNATSGVNSTNSHGASIQRTLSPANTIQSGPNNNNANNTNTARYIPLRAQTTDAAYTPPSANTLVQVQVRGDDPNHLAYSKNALLQVYKQRLDSIENANPLPVEHPHVMAAAANQPLALVPPSALEQELLAAGSVFPEPKKYDANGRMAGGGRPYVARGGSSNSVSNTTTGAGSGGGSASTSAGSGSGPYRPPRRTLERGPSGFTTTTTASTSNAGAAAAAAADTPTSPTANLSPTLVDTTLDPSTTKSPLVASRALLNASTWNDSASMTGSVASDPWSTAATGAGDRGGSDVASISAWSRRSRSRSPSTRGTRASALGAGTGAIERIGTPGGAPPGLSGVSPASTSPGGLDNGAAGATPAETWTLQEWYYRDPTGKVQGPFTSENMQEWLNGNYFELDLPVKATFRSSLGVTSDSGPFCSLTDFAKRFCGGDLRTPFLVARYVPQGGSGADGPGSVGGFPGTGALDVGPVGNAAAGFYDPFTGGATAATAGALRDPALVHGGLGATAGLGAYGAGMPGYAGSLGAGAYGAPVGGLHDYGAAAAGAWGIHGAYGAHHLAAAQQHAQQHLHHGLAGVGVGVGVAGPAGAWGVVPGRGIGGALDPLYSGGMGAPTAAGWNAGAAGVGAYGAFPGAGYGGVAAGGLPGVLQQQQQQQAPQPIGGQSPFERAVQDLRQVDEASSVVSSSTTAAGRLVVPEDSVSKASSAKSKSPERSPSPAPPGVPQKARSPSPVPEPEPEVVVTKQKARSPSPPPARREPSPTKQPEVQEKQQTPKKADAKKAIKPEPAVPKQQETKAKKAKSPSPARIVHKQETETLSALDVVIDDSDAPWPVADQHVEQVQVTKPAASDKRAGKQVKESVSPAINNNNNKVEDEWATAVPLAQGSTTQAKVDLPSIADFDTPSLDAWGVQEDAAAADVWATAAIPTTTTNNNNNNSKDSSAASVWASSTPAPSTKVSKPRPAPVEAPWAKATVAATSSAPKLSDIMKMEASKKGSRSSSDSGKVRMPSVPPAAAGSESVTVLAWGTPTTAMAASSKKQQQAAAALVEDKPTESVWQPAVTRTKSFAEIQAEEAQREAARQRKRQAAEQDRSLAAALLDVSGGTVVAADPVASPTTVSAGAKKGWGETPAVAAASIKAEMAKEKSKGAAKADKGKPEKRIVPGATPAASSSLSSTAGGDSWVTVGSGAKPIKSATSSPAPTVVVPSPTSRVIALAPSAPMPKVTAANSRRGVSEETAKWAMTALKKLPGAAQVVPTLLTMFADFAVTDESASDTVNTVAMLVLDLSTVVDGRAFAAEFVKRRRVDLGLPGTWAVATKSAHQQGQKAKAGGAGTGSDFLVVSKKKKGGKKN